MSSLDLSDYVRIVNRTGTTIKARYDGKDYVFKDNDPVDVHTEVAAHVFGFGVEDKKAAFHRLGWLLDASYEDAMARLDDIQFGEVPNPATNIAYVKKNHKRIKTGSVSPLADGADEGGGDEPPPTEASRKESGTAGL